MHAAPMYIAETSPSQIRGRLISLKEFFIVLGMVVSASNNSTTIDSICPLLVMKQMEPLDVFFLSFVTGFPVFAFILIFIFMEFPQQCLQKLNIGLFSGRLHIW